MNESKAQSADAHEGEAHHEHPRYWWVWFWLLVLTLLEVGVVLIASLPRSFVVVLLLVTAIIKALLVALYFMHLRFEPARLRWVAVVPLPAAVIMVVAIMMEYV